MKIALLGAGKTGSKVLEVAQDHEVTAFDLDNKPTVEALREHDVVISFLTGDVFVTYIDMLVESAVPVATGSTGFDWPKDISERLQQQNVAWIAASNFSLGMNLVHGMISVLAKATQLYENPSFAIHEIHHVHKLDKPSGTALSWREWLGEQADITSERTGDNPGFHELTLQTEFEDIVLSHQSKDRKLFAQGALWAAQRLAEGAVPAGLHSMQEIISKELQI